MLRRSPLVKITAALLALGALAGCGQSGIPAIMGQPVNGAFAALADFPDVDRQIGAAKMEDTEFGVLVKKLPAVTKTKPVTFLTYKALDNNLGVTMPMHLNTLERGGGSNTNMNVLAFTDDIGPKNTFMYYIRGDKDFNALTSPYMPASSRGDLNTGAGTTLRRAMQWGFEQYPSKLRWLDVNNHGGGYYGIAQDDQNDKIIRLPELAKALTQGNKGKKLDVLSFDACLMATAEVAYELRNTAHMMVASEDSSYALGMNYDKTIQAMSAKATVDADDLSRDLVLRAQRKGEVKALFTISALDLSKADKVTQSVDQLAGALMTAMPTHKTAIVMSLKAVKAFHVAGPDQTDFNHRDLNEVVIQLKQRVNDPAVKAACQAVNGALFNKGGMIALSRSTKEEQGVTRGLSVYLPMDGTVDPIYKDTAFAKATRWDEFLTTLK